MSTDEIIALFILIGLAIVYGIYISIRYQLSLRKSREGTRYQELQAIVAAALRKETGYQVVYGHCEDAKYEGKHGRAIYFHYALAFRGDCLWIAPFSFAKKTNAMFLSGLMMRIQLNELGKVIVISSGKKDLLDLVLYHKDGSPSVNCRIEASNIKKPVNICQPQACQAFCEQMERWVNQVNPANKVLPPPWLDEKKNRTASLVLKLGVIGIAVGWCIGSLGIVFGLVGLIKAFSARKVGMTSIYPSHVGVNVAAMMIGMLNILLLPHLFLL